MLAFSLGSLGFLTKFDFDAYPQTLSQAFEQGITVNLRLRFEATVMRSQTRDSEGQSDLVEQLIGEEAEDHHTHRPDGTHNILNEALDELTAEAEIEGEDVDATPKEKGTVRVLAGTAFALANEVEEALETLGVGTNTDNLEA